MKRRIIRSFFIGLLLLCVGAWVGSTRYMFSAGYAGTFEWVCEADQGTVYLLARRIHFVENAWCVYYPLNNFKYIREEEGTHFLGFAAVFYHAPIWGAGAGVPFWFLTTLTASILWLAWRKTLLKPRGFPVELAKPGGVRSDKAE